MKKIYLIAVGLILLGASAVYAAFPYTMSRVPSTGNTIVVEDINTSNNEHINNNIPESIDDFSVNAAEMRSTSDPFPAEAISLATTLDKELRHKRYQINSLIKKFNTSSSYWYEDVTDEGVLWVAGADVVAGTSTPFLADGRRIDVTGTTTITSFDAVGIGTVKTIEFTGALTLTHHTTDLRLPSGLNITTVAGDIGVFHEYASGDWELVAWSGHELAHTHADAANGGLIDTDLVSDTTPQLGGDLDLNSKNIDFPTTANISDCLDEDDMSSDSATKIATQQSIKAYVDASSVGIILGTEQVSTSGTAIDFINIPAGTKKITIMLVGVSTDGVEELLIQLGDAGGIEVSGYLSTVASASNTVSSTIGFILEAIGAAANILHGAVVLTLENSSAFTWVASNNVVLSNTLLDHSGAGSKSLSAELDRIRITTTGTPDDFDAGVINIQFE